MCSCPICGEAYLIGVRGHKGFPTSWVFPTYTTCSNCGGSIRKTGWFSRN